MFREILNPKHFKIYMTNQAVFPILLTGWTVIFWFKSFVRQADRRTNRHSKSCLPDSQVRGLQLNVITDLFIYNVCLRLEENKKAIVT